MSNWLYNRENYPILVAHHGNWDIYRNEKGYCAAIPTKDAEANGCLASHFGDMDYLKHVPDLEYVATMKQITLTNTPKGWMATFHNDPFIESLFQSNTIPTCYGTAAPSSVVLEAISRLNPDHVVSISQR